MNEASTKPGRTGAPWERVFSVILTGSGLALIAASAGADLMRGMGLEEFGVYQVLVACAGVALIVGGVDVRRNGMLARLAAPPEARRDATVKFVALVVQLGLLLLVMRQFEIENKAFYERIAALAFGGFLMHFFLPAANRLAFFLLLCFAAIYLILGVTDGMWLVAVGMALIGICHLPVSFALRVLLLLAAGSVLAAARVEWLQAPWTRAVWPILGSMFMFRLIAYVYDLKHAKVRPTLTSTLAYFFLLPNVAFPLFPVIDYTTYRRTYYDTDRFVIYQRGVDWIFRGVVQLILYRFIYQYVTLAPSEVTSAQDLGRYLVANIGLYVRVSGQFHMIVGLLHLFGMHLPETHRKYFLSASFTDFWRRINIYWKDFMMKLVFNPTYFRLRQLGERRALILATLAVFGVTWALHSYQWFWLLGSFPVTAPDTLFWGILALLLVVNTLYETKHGRKRRIGKAAWTVESVAPVALRTTGTFLVMSILWSLWTSPSLGDWFALLSVDRLGAHDEVRQPGTALALIGLAAGGVLRSASGGDKSGGKSGLRSMFWTTGAILLVYVAGSPLVASRLGGRVEEIAAHLRVAELNSQDATLLQRGYYENLMGVTRFNSQLWEVYMRRPIDWELIWQTDAGRKRDDWIGVELVPSQRVVFRGTILTTNQWGMRDKDYTLEKPPNTFRSATLGASTTMGWSVADDESYEAIVESRLNRAGIAGVDIERFESLNFSVPGYIPTQFLAQLDRVFEFQPDAVFFTAQDNDVRRIIGRLVDQEMEGLAIPFDHLSALARAAVDGAASRDDGVRRLTVHAHEILRWTYTEAVVRCRERGVIPVWVYLPQLERVRPPEQAKTTLFDAAREAGFVMLDLSGVFDSHEHEDVVVSSSDFHPNVLGHRLVADLLYQRLLEHPEIFSPTASR